MTGADSQPESEDERKLAARARSVVGSLAEAGSLDSGSEVRSLHQLEGGWSRHSWRVAIEDPSDGTREFVIRVKPRGSLLDTDLRQEYLTYELLERHGIPVPRAHAFVTDPAPFGGEFFVLDLASGSAPNTWRRRDRERLERNWEEGGSLGADLADILVKIHAIPAGEARQILPDRDFTTAVNHWRGIQDSMSLIADPVVEEAYEWLLANPPEPVEPSLVHGDYRIGNCLIEAGRITAVLDWELAFFGDRRFDLGYCGLDYLAGKFTSDGSKLLGSVADPDWFRRRYEAASGGPVDQEAVRTYAVLGALMLIAILTTGVRVYEDGTTPDVRMAWSRFAIPGLRQDLARLIGW